MTPPIHLLGPSTQFDIGGNLRLLITTMWDQESLRQMVLVRIHRLDVNEHGYEFLISADAADTLIQSFQDRANEARFINGNPMYHYAPPVKEGARPGKAKPKTQATPRKKTR